MKILNEKFAGNATTKPDKESTVNAMAKPDEESTVNVTTKPDEESTVNVTTKSDGESTFTTGKSKDYTFAIAGAVTGALIFVLIVVVIVLCVQKRNLKNRHQQSLKVKLIIWGGPIFLCASRDQN